MMKRVMVDGKIVAEGDYFRYDPKLATFVACTKQEYEDADKFTPGAPGEKIIPLRLIGVTLDGTFQYSSKG